MNIDTILTKEKNSLFVAYLPISYEKNSSLKLVNGNGNDSTMSIKQLARPHKTPAVIICFEHLKDQGSGFHLLVLKCIQLSNSPLITYKRDTYNTNIVYCHFHVLNLTLVLSTYYWPRFINYFDKKDNIVHKLQVAKNEILHCWITLKNFNLEPLSFKSMSHAGWRFWEKNASLNLNHSVTALINSKATSYQTRSLEDAYFGGLNHVFKSKGQNLYCYDQRSQYPWILATHRFPAGDVTLITSMSTDITKWPLGFYKVYVTPPTYLPIPFLLKREIEGVTFGSGTWTGTYYIQEILYALSLGYQFKFIRGYIFDKEIEGSEIFGPFVHKLFEQKEKTKSPTYKFLYKLMLNSLYGSLAYNFNKVQSTILNQELLDKLVKDSALSPFLKYSTPIPLPNQCYIVSFEIDWSGVNTDLSSLFTLAKRYHFRLGRVKLFPISIATTAYGRIHLHKTMTSVGHEHCYYCDTDSIITDRPLSDQYLWNTQILGDALGKFKLECQADYGIFLAQKQYILYSNNIILKRAHAGVDFRDLPDQTVIHNFTNSRNL